MANPAAVEGSNFLELKRYFILMTTAPSTPLKSSLAAVLPTFVWTRAWILFVLVLAATLKFETVPAREGLDHHLTLTFSISGAREDLKRIWRSADCSWYLGIADRGYNQAAYTDPQPHNWVFFPLFPLLERALAPLFGNSFRAGVFISNLAFLAALLVVRRLALESGYSETESSRALWFLCIFPTSYFFLAPLTESLFLLTVAASFLMAQRGRPLLAAVLFSLASATRPVGLIAFPAFALALWEHHRALTLRTTAALLIAPLGGLLYALYLKLLTGSAFAFVLNQAYWGRVKLTLPQLLDQLVTYPFALMHPWNFTLLNVVTFLLGVVMAVRLTLLRRYSWAALVALPLFAALLTGSVLSMCRFTMVLFPIFFELGRLTSSVRNERLLTLVFASLLALMTALYAAHVTGAMA